ncbi:ester cyclase [Streptomyces sp. HUAS TT20]|uniref:ester cyclase n=1 Tax=Streptomyces sp. HUAS TT20 TaxID=3447509 RepID=UPI0021DA94D3|nr:ester cyclase [Streptomyces sp. HUAS 15-9]UXY27295.1 ester cyclase [Streptomyces sp. HUAS 15-9]
MTSSDTGIALFERWTALWNGDFSDPETFLAPDFRIRFGNDPDNAETDKIQGPQGIVDYVSAFRTAKPGLRYTVDGTPMVDTHLGRVASSWYVTLADGDQKSGIDLFEVADGRIATVWSVTGLRRFTD